VISVVIPAYNAAVTIGECLEALGNQTVPRDQFEVIVVDDGSDDETAGIAHARGARVLAVSHGGPAAARNRGVEIARGEFVLFTDADCAPAPDWLERTIAALQPGVAGVKGAYLTRQRGLLPRYVQAEFEERYRRLAQADAIDFVDTYAAGYRRDALVESGGFDSGFSVPSVEDIELSFRLAQRGLRLVFAPDARVYHRHPAHLLSYLRRKWRYGIYRVTVYRRFPGKVVRDSYTPRLMLVQIGLAGLCLGGLLGALVRGRFIGLAAMAALLHLATSLPFALRTSRTDPAVGLVAPVFMFLRSTAQGSGVAMGLARAIAQGVIRVVRRPG
jgi:glycosyltransferase involved in cell wall biosynthesis